MTAISVLVALISMTLRVPEAAISVYMVFLLTKEDAVTTAITGAGLIVAASVGIALSFVFFSVAFAEPALRLMLMTLFIFLGMFFSRTLKVGPLAFGLGFICTLALTAVDQFPVPELMTRGLLWLWVIVTYPAVLVVLWNLALGRRPADLFIDGLCKRLHAAAALLLSEEGKGDEEVRKVRALARAGIVELVKYQRFGDKSRLATRAALLDLVDHLLLVLQTLPVEFLSAPEAKSFLHRAAQACLDAERALKSGRASTAGFEPTEDERRRASELAPEMVALLSELAETITSILACMSDLNDTGRKPLPDTSAGQGLLVSDAFSNPEYVHFALKTTLSAMLAYLVYTGLSWPGIRTCMITCFFVALDSLGETVHKLTLRLIGALIGAGLGITAIICVVPHLDSIAGLCLLMAVGTFPAAFVATGSPRIAYGGWQIAFAFYLCVLHGFGPSTDMVVARDRLIGIVIGNLIVTVVFGNLWPVSIGASAARSLADAVDALAAMLSGGDNKQRITFYSRLAEARRYLELQKFDRNQRECPNVELVTRIGKLFIPVAVLAKQRIPDEHADTARLLDEQLSRSLSACATSLRNRNFLPAPSVDFPTDLKDPRLMARMAWQRRAVLELEKIAEAENKTICKETDSQGEH